MKKSYLLALLSVSLLSGCSNEDLSEQDPDNKYVDMENVVTTDEVYVAQPPKKQVAVVTNQSTEARIAVLNRATTLVVAKGEKTKVEYMDEADFDENEVGNSQYWQVIAFEDSRDADYDYNDLVIHAVYSTKTMKNNVTGENGPAFSIAIQPIALGSTKTITLGCDIYQGNRLIKEGLIIAQDCRKLFFADTEGTKRMINTSTTVEPDYCVCDYKPCFNSNFYFYDQTNKDPFYVNWFIIVDNNVKMYAISAKRTTQMLNSEKRPYGIVLTQTGYTYQEKNQTVGKDWFNYPKEHVNIEKVYPLFGKWLSGEYTGTFQDMYDPAAEGSFDAIGNNLYVVTRAGSSTDPFGKPTTKDHVIPFMRTLEEIADMKW